VGVAGAALPEGATLGAALRAARESASLDVAEISARTRIRGTVIRDLEDDRVQSSGGAVYARGHVKSICAAIGVDPAPYLARFGVQYGGAPQQPLTLPEPRTASDEHLHLPRAARPERRGPHWTVAGVAALVVLVVLLIAGQLGRSGAPTADGAVRPVATPTAAAPAPAQKPAAAGPVATGANLRLRLLGGDSWVSVRNGAQTLFEGVLRNGSVREFRDAKQLGLVVGNAGVVELVCSGRPLGPAGAQGKVRRFTCSAQGIAPA
jgi:hypothetical protein